VKQIATVYWQVVILGTLRGWEDYSKMHNKGIELEDLELVNWDRDQDRWLVFVDA
jgi:hypothetical protein